MEEIKEIIVEEQQVESLESEVNKFVENLPYWAKYLADKILSGNIISDEIIDFSYRFLLDELKLSGEIEKPEIKLNYNSNNIGIYKPDLILSKLENVEGVNALIENQTIEFSPNLTIIFGANGSGKSGYTRLLKKAFYSKAPEEILPNVHIENGHKETNAKFTFKSNGTTYSLNYSENDKPEFEQYAVFDGKCVFRHLEQKNEFEFRPAGLGFFSDYTEAIKQVELKLNSDIQTKQSENEYALWFDGDSEIKTLIENLSASTKIESLNQYVPFSDEDKAEKLQIQQKYDELLLISKGKDKEIKYLETLKKLLTESSTAIEILNKIFSLENTERIKANIIDCLEKDSTAKAEGIENFKTDKVKEIGTIEWKNFIIAAEAFAKKQKGENIIYPENEDNCLFCQQPLSGDAEKLINSYWIFIKSIAEENSRKAQKIIEIDRQIFERINFDIFPDEHTLTLWLNEKYPQQVDNWKQKFELQKSVSKSIISNIQVKSAKSYDEILIDVEEINVIIKPVVHLDYK